MPEVNIKIKASNESAFPVAIDDAATVADLKAKVAAHLDSTGAPAAADSLRLIFAGKVLKDADAVSVYKITEGCT
nr:hypothetical protein HK105_005282 [Polyrhizophydium stewartii]